MNEPYKERPKGMYMKRTPHMKMKNKYMGRPKGIPRKPPYTIQSKKPTRHSERTQKSTLKCAGSMPKLNLGLSHSKLRGPKSQLFSPSSACSTS